MKLGNILFAAAMLVAPFTVNAGGDVEAGKVKAAVCAGCHGADGNSPSSGFPSLAGQHADYIAKQLADYKSGARENGIMQGQAAGLSEEDMADLGAYFASQTAKQGVAAEENIQKGEDIFRGGIAGTNIPACIGCHGANGSGMIGAGYPKLAGQYKEYTIAQLQAFRSGARANDNAAMMRTIAERMTDAEMEAVANYIQGLY